MNTHDDLLNYNDDMCSLCARTTYQICVPKTDTTHVETIVKLVNIGVKPDYTVRLEVDVDEFYKTVGEEKRHFVKPDQKNKKDK